MVTTGIVVGAGALNQKRLAIRKGLCRMPEGCWRRGDRIVLREGAEPKIVLSGVKCPQRNAIRSPDHQPDLIFAVLDGLRPRHPSFSVDVVSGCRRTQSPESVVS